MTSTFQNRDETGTGCTWNRSLFQEVLESAPDGIIVVNGEGKILLVNAETEKMFGYSRNELLGQAVEILVPQQLRKEHAMMSAEYSCNPRPRPLGTGLDLRGQKKDGSIFPVDISLSALETEEGRVVTAVIRDLSAHKRRTALEASQKTVFELLAMGIPLTEVLSTSILALEEQLTGARCSIMLVNERDNRLYLGAAPTLPGVFAQKLEVSGIGPSGACGIAVSRREPVIVTDFSMDPGCAACKDLLLQHGLKACWSFPLFSRDTIQVLGTICIYHPETRGPLKEEQELVETAARIAGIAIEQRATEEELGRLASFPELHPNPIVETDLVGAVTYLNPEARSQFPELLSRTSDHPVLQGLTSLIATFESQRQRCLTREIEVGKKVYEQRICYIPSLERIRVYMIDVTERRQLESELFQIQKMEGIGTLAGGVAHDFNNLLGVIMGYAGLLREKLPPQHPARRDVEEILDATDRATDLTRQLLAFSRRQIIQPRVVNLNGLILNMDKLLRRIIGEDIELVTLPTASLWSVKVDQGQMEQVLVNLAANARDAMPNGGKLTIETANVTLDDYYARHHPEVTPGDYVMLAVSDAGTGMTEEVKARLFEPFFTTKAPGKGTGLGLATCHGILKQNGGSIRVYSEPGHGTTFKIYLPRVEEAPQGLMNMDRTGPLPRGKETILLVEDEEAVRSMTAGLLRNNGYTVLEAANGSEALRLAQECEEEIHLLLTDVVMPQMGGRELAERFRELNPYTKILFTSGYTDNSIVRHALLAPGFAFIQKPFTMAELAYKVRNLLDLHPQGG